MDDRIEDVTGETVVTRTKDEGGHEALGAGAGALAGAGFGMVAGYLASYVVDVDEHLDIVGYILLGIAGAVICGFMAIGLTGSQDYTIGLTIPTIVEAAIGAVIAVVGYNAIRRRSETGRGVS